MSNNDVIRELTQAELESLRQSGSFPKLERLEHSRPSTDAPYDGNKKRDHDRANIAYWLLALLSFIVFSSFLCLAFAGAILTNSAWTLKYGFQFDQLKSLLDVIFGPIIALVSAATGFYFGEKSTNGNRQY